MCEWRYITRLVFAEDLSDVLQLQWIKAKRCPPRAHNVF